MTIWREKNFGAEMQCYATVKALKMLGHEVQVVDYRLSDSDTLSLKHRILKYIISLSPESTHFESFWSQFIPSTKHYKSLEELLNDPPQAELYLIGSDQVWNPDITKEKWETYFLPFGSERIKRVAYASSFGEEKWIWDDKRDLVAGYLSKFKRISVRENAGKILLNDQFGINSNVVLDPTLLHTEYDEIVMHDSTKPNLAYYPLTQNEELSKYSKSLAQTLGLKWIDVNNRKKLLNRITWERTTLRAWLKNIAEASLVITPSFHGLAFSLIYKRQFIIIQNAKGKNRSSRITGLLEPLGLMDRYFTSIDDVKASRVWETPIDYSIIDPKLDILRSKSWEYLKEVTAE